MGQDLGSQLSLFWVIPFAGILLSIALFPLLAPHFWHRHFRRISIGWALVFAVPFVGKFGGQAWHEIVHVYLVDYVPFVILLWALFTVSGGILVSGSLVGTPWLNTTLLAVGTLVASWIGTTGASVLLIRPLLRANAKRHHKSHTVVFFIFLVSNVGGSLTPLGDPPLFLGFLHGVPFFWTLVNLWRPMLVTAGILLGLFFVVDFYWYAREPAETRLAVHGEYEALRLRGTKNFVWLAGVVGAVLLSGYWNPYDMELGSWIQRGELVLISAAHHDAIRPPGSTNEASTQLESGHTAHDSGHAGITIPMQNLTREVLLILMGLLSLAVTPKEIRDANGFSWFPIKEVAWLFAGIFMTIIPALLILKAGEEGAMAWLIERVDRPAEYFWATGLLSSFLDNAPTYLTFFNTALGQFYHGVPEAQAVTQLITEPQQNKYLLAIAAGAVFMGANTYIGNAPNFMVRSIAEEAGVRMPDFFSYIYKYSMPFLLTTFVVVTWLFF
jgi:Na+/H+ antiporter NhaD/arsenite permease-like protein